MKFSGKNVLVTGATSGVGEKPRNCSPIMAPRLSSPAATKLAAKPSSRSSPPQAHLPASSPPT